MNTRSESAPVFAGVTPLGSAVLVRIADDAGTALAAQFAAIAEQVLRPGIAVVVLDLLDLGTLEPAGLAALGALARRAGQHRTQVRVLVEAPAVLTALRRSGHDVCVCDTSAGLRSRPPGSGSSA